MANKLKFSEIEVKLSHRDIIKFANITKEIIEHMWGEKLSVKQANCYGSCFTTIRSLLKQIDKKYLDRHAEIRKFFRKGRNLTHEDNRLHWEFDVSYRGDIGAREG